MKYAYAVLLIGLIPFASAVGQAIRPVAAVPREENIHDLMIEVLSRNPELAAEAFKIRAAKTRVAQAGSLMDPELNLKLMEIPGTDFNKATYANVELMQVFTFPSKLSAQRDIAELLVEHAHHGHMETALTLIAELKSELAMLWYARESLAINDSNKELLKTVLHAAQTSYTVGKTSQQDVIRTNIELARLGINDGKIRERIITAESKLRALLNRPATNPIGTFDIDRQPVQLPPLDLLIGYADENRPMLLHDSLNVLEKQLTVDLMKKEYLPDFKLSLEYVRMPVLMENKWSISAGMTLPFAPWTIGKTTSRIQEAQAEEGMVSSMYTASKNAVESKIRSDYALLQALEKQLTSTRQTILPQLRQSIQVLVTEYETGKTTFLMLLDGYRMYNEMQLDYAMALANYQDSLASLERSVGVSDLQLVVASRKDDHQ